MIEALNRLNDEVIMLFHHLDLFKKLNETISKNPILTSMDSTLLTWMQRAFSVDLIIGLCRVCDTDKRTQSLVRFLQKLKNHPDYLTRDAYIKLYESDNPLIVKMAHTDFNRLAGNGVQVFAVKNIDADITRLTDEAPCKKVRDFRDQYIAHSEAVKDSPPPTYGDLFAAFEVIKEVVKKYNLLLRAANMVDLTPTIQGNWEEALTIPWKLGTATIM